MKSPNQVLRDADNEKKTKVWSKFMNVNTPLCINIDGLVGPEISLFVSHIRPPIIYQMGTALQYYLQLVRTKLSFPLVRAKMIYV